MEVRPAEIRRKLKTTSQHGIVTPRRGPRYDLHLRIVEAPRHERLRDDLGADPLVGEDFQQNGMGRAAIDDVRLPHPPGQSIQAGVNFG